MLFQDITNFLLNYNRVIKHTDSINTEQLNNNLNSILTNIEVLDVMSNSFFICTQENITQITEILSNTYWKPILKKFLRTKENKPIIIEYLSRKELFTTLIKTEKLEYIMSYFLGNYSLDYNSMNSIVNHDNWGSIYFNKFLHILLNNWMMLNSDTVLKDKIIYFLLDKIDSVNYKYPVIVFIKENASALSSSDYFIKSICKKKLKISDFLILIGCCDFKLINNEYHISLIISFFFKTEVNNELINFVIEYIDNSNNTFLKKIVLAVIINRIEIIKINSIIFNRFIKYCIETFGDPSNELGWGITEHIYLIYNKDLKSAKARIHYLILEDILIMFFTYCIDDPERKEFWIKQIPKMTDVKIAGTIAEYEKLEFHMRNRSIDDNLVYFKKRWIKSKKGKPALLMKISDYLFVEFVTANNAFYCYSVQENHNNFHKFEKIYIDDTVDLKDTSIALSGTADILDKNQFRFMHKESWTYTLDQWISYKCKG